MVKVKSAPPPLHSQCFIAFISFFFIGCLPTFEELDKTAKIETFTRSLFLPLPLLALTRLIFASLIWVTCFNLINGPGFVFHPAYLKSSYLVSAPWELKGLTTLALFTNWGWIILGISFTLSGYIALTHWIGYSKLLVTSLVLRIALISFEIAAPLALLISAVVRYALWPKMLKSGGRPPRTARLKSWSALIRHNFNTVMVGMEMCLLGCIPVRLRDLGFVSLFGCLYVLFAWTMANRWTPYDGPQYIYFFLDTTLGWTSTICLVALLGVLLGCYSLFWVAEYLFEGAAGSLVHISCVIATTTLVCRFKD